MNRNQSAETKYIDKMNYKTKDECDKAAGRQKLTEIWFDQLTLNKRKFALRT